MLPINENLVEMHQQFKLNDYEFEKLRTMVFQHTGIHLSESKRELVYNRFAKRMRALGVNSFSKYYRYIQDNPDREIEYFSNAITTNLTSFFRETHHFELLAKKIIPELLDNPEHRIRIWSAGCSSGEEPYSIAITLLQHIPDIDQWDIKILATDLNSKVLNTAENGIYSMGQLKKASTSIIHKWFRMGVTKENKDQVKIKTQVKSLITFKQLNLIDTWPMKGPFDIIFCRNVVIYFNKDTQSTLFEKFSNLQHLGAYLFIGHSENIENVTHHYQHIGQTLYQKVK